MPSSTLLPTPEPANRPMRWPRPTVSSELMARTPTSSVRVMGARVSGLIGTPVRRVRSSQPTGPLPSSGSPAPSMTRPSNSGPTLTVPAPGRGITRALGLRPWMSPVGIRNSRSPEKPTTSASTRLPSPATTSQRSPTAAWQPCASSVSPTMRVSRPSTGGGGKPCTVRWPRARCSLHCSGRRSGVWFTAAAPRRHPGARRRAHRPAVRSSPRPTVFPRAHRSAPLRP